MKKIAIILANEMNDIDIFVPLTVWKRANISVDLISIEKKNSVMTNSGVKVGCTSPFESVNITQYHAIYIPGGEGVNRLYIENWPVKNGKGAKKLAENLEKFRASDNKYILVTEKSAELLDHLNILGNVRIAGCNSNFEVDNSIEEEILINNNLVSVKGYWNLTDFAIEVVGILLDKKKKDAVSALYH